MHEQQAEDHSSILVRPQKRQRLSLEDVGTQELTRKGPLQSPLSIQDTCGSTAMPANATLKCTDSEASDSALSDGGHMYCSQEAWAGDTMQACLPAATLCPSTLSSCHGG